ncbi:MAG: tetratricopeptide repeat protein [Nitrospirae bacterium]|nr:MAG: tetratricopeptide repeat protein [Nitrospirota bacterium]
MGNIIPFPAKTPPKFGFERVTKRRAEHAGQSELSPPARILRFPSNLCPFDEALLLDERGDSRAGECYQKAISEGDLTADAFCNLGIIEHRAGRVAKAFDCFTKSLEQDPRHFEAHYNLGNLYLEGNDLRLAKLHYELAAEIDPRFPNLFFNLGLTLALLEEIKPAIDALVTYQRLVPPEEAKLADDLITCLRRLSAGSDRDASC